MPVNIHPPDAESLFSVTGLELGWAEAAIRKPDRKDLLVVRIAEGANVAGVFTQNRFAAAPVLVCREHLQANRGVRALLINTGNANAGTGEQCWPLRAKSEGIGSTELLRGCSSCCRFLRRDHGRCRLTLGAGLPRPSTGSRRSWLEGPKPHDRTRQGGIAPAHIRAGRSRDWEPKARMIRRLAPMPILPRRGSRARCFATLPAGGAPFIQSNHTLVRLDQ